MRVFFSLVVSKKLQVEKKFKKEELFYSSFISIYFSNWRRSLHSNLSKKNKNCPTHRNRHSLGENKTSELTKINALTHIKNNQNEKTISSK